MIGVLGHEWLPYDGAQCKNCGVEFFWGTGYSPCVGMAHGGCIGTQQGGHMVIQNGHEWNDPSFSTCCNHCAVTVYEYVTNGQAGDCPGGTHKHSPTNTEASFTRSLDISEKEADRLWRTIVDAAAR